MKAKNLLFLYYSGAGALAVNVIRNQKYQLRCIELHLSAAPTTSENYTISLDAKRGTAWDVNYLTRDLSVGSVTDLVSIFGEGYEFDADDELDIAYTNTDARTWGLRVEILLLED